VYVEVIRNTPILVQIFFLYLGLGQFERTRFDVFTVAWLSVMIWGGAFNTENFRAGFEAVPFGYREAGLALGFGRLRTFLNVTLPIGGRIALPASINTYISVLKNTSLLLVIGYGELTTVAVNIQACAEAVVFLEKSGVDLDAALEALAGGLAGSTVLNRKKENFTRRDFAPGFRIDLHHKDMGIVTDAARAVGAALPVGAVVAQLVASLRAQGDGGLDHSALLRAVERLSAPAAA
jgi:hypothetical protein